MLPSTDAQAARAIGAGGRRDRVRRARPSPIAATNVRVTHSGSFMTCRQVEPPDQETPDHEFVVTLAVAFEPLASRVVAVAVRLDNDSVVEVGEVDPGEERIIGDGRLGDRVHPGPERQRPDQ
jgi:hypothetical protein